MPIRKKGYRSLFTRGLLLAGYFFLFAGQFNYRYFDIANFYVYGHDGNMAYETAGKGNHPTAAVDQEQERHTVALHDNSQRPAHLGIDKRFQFKQGVRVPQIRAPGAFHYIIAKTFFTSFTPVYSSTDLPTNSLRGPPCA